MLNLTFYKSGIARRLITYMVLFSSFITLLITAVQLFWDYKNDVDLIHEQLDQVPQVHLKSLTASLWASDIHELKTHLEGILQVRDMQYLQLRDENEVLISLGRKQSEDVLVHTYPMIYADRGRSIEIGSLTVVASLSNIYKRLFDKAWMIFISNGVKTFLVASFMLMLFHALNTRHLIRIANFTGSLEADNLNEKLSLNRTRNKEDDVDELDLVVDALNKMQENMKLSFTALAQSEERFQVLAQVSPVGIFRTDSQGSCNYANSRWCDMVHRSERSLLNDSWVNAINTEDQIRVAHQWREAVGNNLPFSAECRVQSLEGKFIWLLIMIEAEYDAVHQVVGFVAAITDITERKRTEGVFKSLATSGAGMKIESFLSDVLQSLAELYQCRYAYIAQLSEDENKARTLAVWDNGQSVENFEYALQGTPCQDIVNQTRNIILQDVKALYPDDQLLVDMEVESYFGWPLIASNGKNIGILAVMDVKSMELESWMQPVFEVISTRAALELEREFASQELHQHRENLEELVKERTVDLAFARDEAERANLAKSEFLSRMSHELRTPLNAILGFGQLLDMESDQLTTSQEGNVVEILTAGHHLLSLINEVLDLARIESGKLVVSMEKVLLNDLLPPCLTLVQTQADARDVDITEHLSGKGYAVHADYARLKQVLVNLLSNAVKYNCERGKITLDGEIVNQQRLRISVTDTGKGLSEEEMAKLFSSFVRLNEVDNVEGTGIGLVITKHLVELMGGSVGIESRLGEGSTFWVELDLSKAA